MPCKYWNHLYSGRLPKWILDTESKSIAETPLCNRTEIPTVELIVYNVNLNGKNLFPVNTIFVMHNLTRFNFLIITVVRNNLSLQRHGSWVHIGFRSHDRAWKCDGCYVSVTLCTKFKDVKKIENWRLWSVIPVLNSIWNISDNIITHHCVFPS